MELHYGFWNIMLLFPEAIRLLIEVLVSALLVIVFWPISKYIFIILAQFIKSLNYLVLGSIRFILIIFPVERKYKWDEEIAKRGKRNNIWLLKKIDDIRKSKRKDVLHKKTAWILVSCFYIGALFPFFHLDKYVSERYVNYLYSINHFFVGIETKATVEIDNYPPFWVREEEAEAELAEYVEETQIEEEKEPIYLKLNAETTYANIRADAGMYDNILCMVSKEDEICYEYVYEYDYEYDSGRYWLKVTLPNHDNLEGWISSKLIEPEIIETLDLQN